MNLEDLRKSAIDIFRHALSAVDAREATRKSVVLDGDVIRVFESEFHIAERPVFVVAFGKAALSMVLGLNDVLGSKIAGVVISTAHSATVSLPLTHKLFRGGHPLPNQQSLVAAEAAFELLDQANGQSGLVIFLISGGGSAMLERPISTDITLEDLQEANRQLITSGATISEINAVRRSLSAVKGGGLAAYARDAQILTLIVADTNAGDESSVASGPTLAPPGDAPNPLSVLTEYGLTSSLPEPVVRAVRNYKKDPASHPPAAHYVLLDNSAALDAAARKANELGFSTAIAPDVNEQPVVEGSNLLLDRSVTTATHPFCLISGGEFSCRIRGSGRGGRNLETVLRCAIKLDHDGQQDHIVVLSAGTDGVDGSSFAAGAIADEMTVRRARELGLEPVDYLQRSDSHAFFEALDDLIVTGPTGTNVRDLRIVLCG